MASHKLRSFEEYDAAKAEREGKEHLEQKVERTIEEIVIGEIRREKLTGFGVIVRHPFDMVRVLTGDIGPLFHRYLEQNKGHYKLKAEERVYKSLFQENITDLLRCAVRLSKKNKEYLTPEQQQDLFTRLTDEFQLLSSRPSFSTLHNDIPYLSYVQRRYHLPDDEEGLRKLRNVLQRMRQEGYLTRENADTLFRLMTQKMPKLEERPVPQTLATSAPGVQAVDIAEKLGKMIPRFPREETADKVLDKEREITQFTRGLEAIVGRDNAIALIKLVDTDAYHAEGLLTKYLTTVQKVEDRLKQGNGHLREKYGVEQHPERYASLDELLRLKRELYGETALSEAKRPQADVLDKQAPAIDLSKLDLKSYRILHRGDPAVERRLQSLIDTGVVQVDRSEHFYSRSEKGARGRNILKRIGHDLERIFTDLDLPRPEFQYNFGQNTISIPEQTRTFLGQIREEVYKIQR